MKRLLPFIILLLLLLAGFLAIPFILRPESHRTEITDALTKLLHKPVVIGKISMGYWPPTLRLEKLVVVQDNEDPPLEIEKVSGVMDWGALFHLKIVPTALEFSHWTLRTQRKADGSWDAADWLLRTPEPSGKMAWPIEKVAWKEGEIHGIDRFAGAPQELVLSGVEGSWVSKQQTLTAGGTFSTIGAPARFTITAKGNFFSSPQWAGDLQLLDQNNACTFHLEKHGGSFDAKGGAAHWRLTNLLALLKFYGRGVSTAVDAANLLTLENWQLHVSGDAQRAAFEHNAAISGGTSEIKGTVETQPSGLLARADGALKGVPVEALLGLVGENIPLDGTVTGLAKGFELMLSSQTSSSLKGQGYWELKDGHYRPPEASLNKLSKAKTMAYIRKKYPDVSQKGIPVSRLSAHWQAKNGMIQIDDGFLASPDAKAAWVGKLDVARQGMDGYFRMQIHEKDPKLAGLVPVKYRTQPANGRLQGSWQEWFLRAISSSKVPAPIQTKLRNTLNQK